MLQLITTTEQEKNDVENSDAVILDEDDNIEKLKEELSKIKEACRQKDKIIQEKDDLVMEKQIEITTFKDEVETLEREVAKKDEEIELMIASKNSLDEEISQWKVKTMEESKKVEKVNFTLKKIFKEKDLLEKENLNLKKMNDPKKQENEGQNPVEMKKKLQEKQKENADLKAKNKKLADDLAEEQAKVNKENPNSLILTNLLKTRTAELKRLEKEKENNVKNMTEVQAKLKEINDKLNKAENKNTRLETEVDNLIEILDKKDQTNKEIPQKEKDDERQIFHMDGNNKRCSFNNRSICRNNPCRFIHSNFVCKSYSSYGKCDQGVDCPGRHPTGVCNKWRSNNCSLEAEVCQFRHPEIITPSGRDGENKRKRSTESSPTSKAKNTKPNDSVEDMRRNDFLCKSISELHRRLEAYEKKDQANHMKEEDLFQAKFNAPPVPAFTSYLPIQNTPQPLYSMSQAGCSTTFQGIQPAGRVVPSPAPIPAFPNTSTWVPPQVQWSGQGQLQRQGAGQSQHQQQESSQLPYPGVGQVYNPFFQ